MKGANQPTQVWAGDKFMATATKILSTPRPLAAVPPSTQSFEESNPLFLHGVSLAVQKLRQQISTAAHTEYSLRIHGDVEEALLVAKMIHAQSASRCRPFLVVDCSLPFASQVDRFLFGYGPDGRRAALECERAT